MSGLYSKFVIKEKKDDVIHSSGYGVAQNGGSMGASSSVGFSERIRINNNRSRVKGYGASKIATDFQSNHARASVFSRDSGERSTSDNGGTSGRYGINRGAGSIGSVGNSEMSKYSSLRRNGNFGSSGYSGGTKGR